MPALVSAIIPTYNAERFVEEAIHSALGQTYRPVEILVVDDASTDRTVEKVREFGPRVRLLRQKHAGVGAARNLGVTHATGRYIAFLDADDIWPPTKLSRQMEILYQDPTCDLLFGHVEHFRETSGDSGGPVPGYLPGTMLAKREVFDRTGPLATDLKVGEFIDWYARARDAGLRSRMEPEVWLRRRIHGANLTVREQSAHGDYLRVVKAAIDRRRHTGSEGR
jgi:glycosyltransferase involved in cell wall biosynthesis